MTIATGTYRDIVTFLAGIGIEVVETDSSDLICFLPGLEIREGRILCDPNVARTTDLLHEAGHLAVIPSRFRQFVSGNVETTVVPHYDAYMDNHPLIREDGSEDPVIRAMLQSGETEAIAWSWAAGQHLGIADEDIMPDDAVFSVSIDPDEALEPGGAETRECLRSVQYLGINGLMAAGMVATRAMRIRAGAPGYPEMLKWVQD